MQMPLKKNGFTDESDAFQFEMVNKEYRQTLEWVDQISSNNYEHLTNKTKDFKQQNHNMDKYFNMNS